MFKEIFRFEVRNGFRKFSNYIYFGILLLLTLLIGAAGAGVFSTAKSDSNVWINSALEVGAVLTGTGGSLFSILVSVILISTVGTAVQKDYQYKTHPLFFTKPISKNGYFFGRLFGSLVVATLIFSGLLIGYLIGTIPAVGKSNMGPYQLMNFLQPFLLFTVLNTFFLGLIFFSLITFLRNTGAAYVFAIVFMVVQLATQMVGSINPDYKHLAAVLEPTGGLALGTITEYWTPLERNSNLIPLKGALIYNRMLWLGIAVVIGAFCYTGFRFSQFLQPLQLFKRKSDEEDNAPKKNYYTLPSVRQKFDQNAWWTQLKYLTGFEFRKTIRTSFFLVIVLLSIFMLVLVVVLGDRFAASPTYWVTHEVISVAMGIFPFFAMVFLIFSTGNAVWRNREQRVDELIGATPVDNTVLFLSRLISLVLIMILFYSLAAAIGIILQLYLGVYTIDLWQYFVAIVQSTFQGIVVLAFCLAIQCFSTDKYLGFFFSLIPIMILPIVFGLLEWEGDLYDFNTNGLKRPYSDMNGFGGFFTNWPFYRVYWLSVAGLLCMLGLLLFPRGKEKSLKARWRLSGRMADRRFKVVTFFLSVLALLFGGFIFYQTTILQNRLTGKESERLKVEWEKKYKKYESLNQPRIVASEIHMDIFTRLKEFKVKGRYTLKNQSAMPLDTIYIDYPAGKKSHYHFFEMSFSNPHITFLKDNLFGVMLVKLNKPLQPGDSVFFNFKIHYRSNGLFDRINSIVLSNGSFLNNESFPSIGYNNSHELDQNTARKEYGLKPKARMAAVNDSLARRNNYISHDADWIRFESTVSTDDGQIAIAPGYLQKEWRQNGRHYFQYKMDSPILNFYSFLSAAYQVKKTIWNNVAIEIYYQKGHEYNLDRMINSIKKSLDYYTKNFGPYQHRQVRILEFPRYQQFAQSFPNTIPYSEDIGFILKVKNGPDKIDLPFYVTAHEVAHQWWAHQVIGGNVQGSVVMSETMSQYSALMVMEKEYGKDKMRRFLKNEMDNYLRGRTFEGKGELPLMLCENQQYIHYNKGSVVMYALKDFIGEDSLNKAIRAYLNKNRYYGPLYTNSAEFVSYLRNATPDSLKYIIGDWFEKITIYENYVKALDVKKQGNNYRVTLTVGSAKFYADSIGKQKVVAVNDYMDIGVFAERKPDGSETPLVLKRIRMDKPEKTFEFIVSTLPVKAGIDPYLKLIDRTPKNNAVRFGQTVEKVDLDPNKPQMNFQLGQDDDW